MASVLVVALHAAGSLGLCQSLGFCLSPVLSRYWSSLLLRLRGGWFLCVGHFGRVESGALPRVAGVPQANEMVGGGGSQEFAVLAEDDLVDRAAAAVAVAGGRAVVGVPPAQAGFRPGGDDSAPVRADRQGRHAVAMPGEDA